MSTLFAIALTTGILSGVWGWIAVSLGLLSWAGFLGCTSYFASPKDGLKGLGQSLLTNLTGVFWAMVIIHASQWVGIEIIGYVVTALVAFIMCIQAQKILVGLYPRYLYRLLCNLCCCWKLAIGDPVFNARWCVWLSDESQWSLVISQAQATSR